MDLRCWFILLWSLPHRFCPNSLKANKFLIIWTTFYYIHSLLKSYHKVRILYRICWIKAPRKFYSRHLNWRGGSIHKKLYLRAKLRGIPKIALSNSIFLIMSGIPRPLSFVEVRSHEQIIRLINRRSFVRLESSPSSPAPFFVIALSAAAGVLWRRFACAFLLFRPSVSAWDCQWN